MTDQNPAASAEVARRLIESQRSTVDFRRDSCLHELIAEQALRTPAATVSDGATSLTLAEVNERADHLAYRLHEMGVKPDELVGVCMSRSTDLVVSLLGVLKAGGAFVPLEPDQPRQRLGLMLDEARPRVVLTTAVDAGVLPVTNAHILRIDSELDGWMTGPKIVGIDCRPDHLAYVMFTSGSTGPPKGVMVEHRALVNQLVWRCDSFGITPADRILHKTPLSFDPALSELFCPLITGASLRILPPGDHANAQRVMEVMRSQRITVMPMVPSMLEDFIKASDPGRYESLRLVTCGGESLSQPLVTSFFEHFGSHVELRNMYGPTETVLCACSWRCGPSDSPVPIGWPVANTQMYVLDANLKPVADGAHGELCIGGEQLARGYLNDPVLTNARFVCDPHRPERRLYRTGDLGRRRSDGAFEFLGRADDQIKIGGTRIELGEIEAAMAAHPEVQRAIATLRRDATGNERLVAYVVPAQTGLALTLDDLYDFLSDMLPYTMLPSALVVTDHLPLTPSGKLDRKALPDPDWRPTVTFRPATNATEKILVTIVTQLFARDNVGTAENFLALGAHSLLLAQLVARIGDKFGVDMPLRAAFDHPSIAAMAGEIERLLIAELGGMSDDEAKRLASEGNGTLDVHRHPQSGE